MKVERLPKKFSSFEENTKIVFSEEYINLAKTENLEYQ